MCRTGLGNKAMKVVRLQVTEDLLIDEYNNVYKLKELVRKYIPDGKKKFVIDKIKKEQSV